jgi:hypothetical protein
MSGKGGGDRAVLLVTAEPQDFVQCAPGKAAIRQCPVDLGDAEAQHSMRHHRPLDPPDALPELGKKGAFPAGHTP